MNKYHYIKFVIILCCLTTLSTLRAQIHVVSERPSAVYQVGEQINFNVLADYTGQANYVIKLDARSPILEQGSIEVKAGQNVQISYTHYEPAFLICEVNGAISSKAGVAVSPFELDLIGNEPSDFDQFWQNQLNLINDTWMDPVITFLSGTANSDTYRLNLANIEGRRVHGFISIPKGNGPFPAFVTMPSYGSGAGHVFARPFDAEILNSIVVVLSIHNAQADVGDQNAYMPDDYTDQNKNYYRYGLLGAVQAINYLYTRNDFDKVNLGVMGISQGGGLSTCVAGLDDRVKLLVASVPALCHHAGLHYDRTSGHPHYLYKSRNTYASDPSHENKALEATKYFDAAIFAKRYKGPSCYFMSFEDEVCPPSSVMTANNQLVGEKVIFYRRESGHDNPDYWQGRLEFIRTHMPTTREPLINAPKDQSYKAKITGNNSISVGQSLNLNTSISLDGRELSLPLRWDQHSGPGSVEFSDVCSSQVSATFAEAGTYVLKVVYTDDRELDKEDSWVQVIDYVTVTVF